MYLSPALLVEVTMRLLSFFALTVCWSIAASTMAVEPQTMPLWPEGAPGALGQADGDIPKAIVYDVESTKPSPVLVILPGGGYGGLAIDHEGHQIARWANQMGMSAFICQYRHRGSGKGYGHPHPLMDAQRIIRLVRANKDKWNIDANRVGIIGFSAGGHLCSTVLTHFDAGNSAAADPIDRESSRPDFGILCYPVIDFDQPYTHKAVNAICWAKNRRPNSCNRYRIRPR